MLAWQRKIWCRKTGGKERDYPQKCPDDRRLSGNELLSCTRRIYRALGKSGDGAAYLCASRGPENTVDVFEIHVTSRCQSCRQGRCTLKATVAFRWRRGQPASVGSWNQGKTGPAVVVIFFFDFFFDFFLQFFFLSLFFVMLNPCKRI